MGSRRGKPCPDLAAYNRRKKQHWHNSSLAAATSRHGGIISQNQPPGNKGRQCSSVGWCTCFRIGGCCW